MLDWIKRVLDAGVTDTNSFERNKQLRVLNLMGSLGVCLSSVFFTINIIHGRYVLSGLNFTTGTSCMLLIYLHSRHKFVFGHLFVCLFMSAIYTTGSILYNNNMEYFLLLVIGLVLVLMKDLRIILFVCICNTTLFLLIIKYREHFHFYESLSETRRFINLTIWVLLFVVFLYYFKKQNLRYQKLIETKNEELEQHEIQLLQQKQQLEESNSQLVKLNATKEKLFSIVAHDIRTPIGGLKTSLDLLNQQIISKEEFMELSQELAVRVNYMQGNLDNLLEWSQSQMKGIEVKPQPYLLKSLVLDSLELLQQSLAIKNIKIDLDIPPHYKIHADTNHIKLVIRNLVTNAIKFSYKGSTIYLQATKQNPFIIFSVKDSGTGMPSEKAVSIFQQHEITSAYGTQNERGTGLGLVLCKEFIDKNGGEIWAESEEGKGSTFSFSIPAA
jgi:two-component system sensor histidine kinase/response regulator